MNAVRGHTVLVTSFPVESRLVSFLASHGFYLEGPATLYRLLPAWLAVVRRLLDSSLLRSSVGFDDTPFDGFRVDSGTLSSRIFYCLIGVDLTDADVFHVHCYIEFMRIEYMSEVYQVLTQLGFDRSGGAGLNLQFLGCADSDGVYSRSRCGDVGRSRMRGYVFVKDVNGWWMEYGPWEKVQGATAADIIGFRRRFPSDWTVDVERVFD